MRYAFGGVRKDVAVAILSFLSPWGLMPRYACPLLADRPRAFRADARTGPPRRHGPHPGNEFTDFPACMDPAELVDSYLNRLDDMRFVLDQILVEDDRVGSPFRRKLDRRRIGMSGHSFGGLDTLRVAALDPRVRAAL